MRTAHVHKYLVQFEVAEDTRWTFEPGEELELLRLIAEVYGETVTKGPRPAVTVVRDEENKSEPVLAQ